MARAKRLEPAPSRELVPVAEKLRKCCGTCRGFRPHNGFPAWGDCMPSMAGGAAPRATQDLACCSEWSPYNG